MARRRSGKKIDFLHWTFGSGNIGAHSAGTAAVTMLAAQHLPETLMRTRGEFTFGFDAVQTPGSIVQMACGLILVPEGTSTTVLWSPDTDADAPWFWFDTCTITYEEYVVDVIHDTQLSSCRRVIDSKAMRIVKNMEVQAVIETTNISGSPNTNFIIGARFLAGT